jgi:hypothetical protein
LVTGLGNLANVEVIVTSGGNPVTVTSNTIGDTTTYTITLDPAFVTMVNSHYNTILANGGGITWNDSGVVGGLRTFTPQIAVQPANSLAFKIIIEPVGGVVNVGVTDVTVVGTMFQTPTADTWAVLPTYINSTNGFVVNDFYNGTASDTYKVFATMTTNSIIKSSVTGNALFSFITPEQFYNLNMLDHGIGEFRFRLDSFSNITTGSYTTFKQILGDNLYAEIDVLITE